MQVWLWVGKGHQQSQRNLLKSDAICKSLWLCGGRGVQFQYNRLNRKLPFSITKNRGQSQKSILLIIKNLVSKIFSIFANLHIIISIITAPKSFISTHYDWKWRRAGIEILIYRYSSYRNIDMENVEPPNHIEAPCHKFHIEPALAYDVR